MTDPTLREDLFVHRAPANLLEGARARRHLHPPRHSSGWLALAAAALLTVGFLAGRTTSPPLTLDQHSATAATDAPMVTVRFVLQAGEAQNVSVTGTWNDWTVEAHPLTQVEPGLFVGEIAIPRGQHEYMFVVDGDTWIADPNAPHSRDDGFGQRNSVLEV